jgi:hypothetical protein
VPDTGFALSAKVWKASTRLTVRALLGAGTKVLTSPPKGPAHPREALRSRIHLVNCHGNPLDPSFVGEWPQDVYADAMHSRKLTGLRSGTVAAFECCYGAELYDPREIVPAVRSIAHAYLAQGASGVVASTTIAYGMPDDVSQADVLCRLFLEHVRRGASLGRAFLEARLAYVAGLSVADGFDKKTLAQFVLLGDPSIHPFAVAAPAVRPPRPKATGAARESGYAARSERRRRLVKAGAVLGVTMAFTVPDARPDRRSHKLAAAARTRMGKRLGTMQFLRVHEPMRQVLAGGPGRKGVPQAQRAVLAVRRVGREDARVERLEAVLAYEVDGQVKTQILVSR